jgi:hypothetical protein
LCEVVAPALTASVSDNRFLAGKTGNRARSLPFGSGDSDHDAVRSSSAKAIPEGAFTRRALTARTTTGRKPPSKPSKTIDASVIGSISSPPNNALIAPLTLLRFPIGIRFRVHTFHSLIRRYRTKQGLSCSRPQADDRDFLSVEFGGVRDARARVGLARLIVSANCGSAWTYVSRYPKSTARLFVGLRLCLLARSSQYELGAGIEATHFDLSV